MRGNTSFEVLNLAAQSLNWVSMWASWIQTASGFRGSIEFIQWGEMASMLSR
jgi:hypothetical protein